MLKTRFGTTITGLAASTSKSDPTYALTFAPAWAIARFSWSSVSCAHVPVPSSVPATLLRMSLGRQYIAGIGRTSLAGASLPAPPAAERVPQSSQSADRRAPIHEDTSAIPADPQITAVQLIVRRVPLALTASESHGPVL